MAAGTGMEEVFEEVLPTSHNFRLSSGDLLKLGTIREEELKKKNAQKMKRLGLSVDHSMSVAVSKPKSSITGTDNIKQRKSDVVKVNIEYLYTLMPYLKRYNSACALCVITRYFGENKSRPSGLLLKCLLKCSGKTCKFTFTVHVFNNGSSFVTSSSPSIFHLINERISRPIRGSRRRAIKDKFQAGGSVYRVHAQYHQQRTIKEKTAFNYDATGKSKAIFKKIKAEATAETLLAADVNTGLFARCSNFRRGLHEVKR